VNLGWMVIFIYLSKYVKFTGSKKKKNSAQIEESGSEISIQENHIYQRKCLSDSEEEHPIIYNHNNVLSSLTFNDYQKKLEQRDIDKREKKIVSSL